jgi:hypothetical protein
MRYLCLLFLATLLTGCFEYDELQSVPVLMSRSDVEAAVKLEAPRAVHSPGATALHKNALYIVEQYEGVHILDNSNPASPKKSAFLRVPGIWHVAIANDHLIVDNSSDLVSFRLENPLAPNFQARGRDLLSNPPSKYSAHWWRGNSDTLVVGYKDTVVRNAGGMM